MGKQSGAKGRYSRKEKAGINAVRRTLAEDFGWTPEDVVNDFGVDLTVEVCDSNPTGRFLGLQVKSGPSYFKERRGDYVVFRFSPSHYSYWTGYSLPIVVVLYHTDSRKAIWEHVTPEKCIKCGRRWKLNVPLRQELTPQFAPELERIAADQPLAVLVKREEGRLSNLDPRFHVSVLASASGSVVSLSAKEDVRVNLSITGDPEILFRAQQSIESGKPVELDASDISFEGSQLLTEIQKSGSGKVVLRIGISRRCLVGLVAHGTTASVALPMMAGSLTAGTKTYSLISSLERTPLSLQYDTCVETKTVSITIKYEVPALAGQNLLQLKHFETIHDFFSIITAGGSVSLSILAEGFPPINIDLKEAVQDSGRVQRILTHLADARLVAQSLDVDPVMPSLTEGDLSDIDELPPIFRQLPG